MTQWEIYTYPFPAPEQPHPFVIISNRRICDNQAIEAVNGLMCTTVRAQNQAKPHHVLLNGADGMDWLTVVSCNVIYQLRKVDLRAARRGLVSVARRRQIVRTLNIVFDFNEVL